MATIIVSFNVYDADNKPQRVELDTRTSDYDEAFYVACEHGYDCCEPLQYKIVY